MKVTTNRIWSTMVFIWIAIIVLMLTSCRVVKKDWVKENFTEKATVKESLTVQDSVLKTEISRIETKITGIEKTVSKIETSKASESSNETTNISGTLTAEDGKEKSVTVGGTTIKSNGANVSFETISSKATSKEIESRYNELTKELNEQKTINQNIRAELSSLKSEFTDFKSTYSSEKTSKSKEVTKKGFSFGFVAIIIIVVIVIIAFFYLKNRIRIL